MRLAARNLLILPAVGSALKFQQQQAPKAPAVALNRRQLLTLPAAALALPQSARADQAWAGPRWAEVDTKLPTNDQARVFRDLEDGFEVAYPSNNWMRTQPLPELLGGAPPRGTRFAATDLGQGAVIAVTCQPLSNVDWPAIQAVKKNGAKSMEAAAARFARKLLDDRAAELGWSSARLSGVLLLEHMR